MGGGPWASTGKGENKAPVSLVSKVFSEYFPDPRTRFGLDPLCDNSDPSAEGARDFFPGKTWKSVASLMLSLVEIIQEDSFFIIWGWFSLFFFGGGDSVFRALIPHPPPFPLSSPLPNIFPSVCCLEGKRSDTAHDAQINGN